MKLIKQGIEYGNIITLINNLEESLFKCNAHYLLLQFFVNRQYQISSENEDGSEVNPLTTVVEFDPSAPTELTLGKNLY